MLAVILGSLLLWTGRATVQRAAVEGINGEWYTKYLLLNVIIQAAAIYMLLVNQIGKRTFSQKTISVVGKASELSIGVYFVHALVTDMLGNGLLLTWKNARITAGGRDIHHL